MIKIWKNTKTLDAYIDSSIFTSDKKEADIALLGSKTIDPDEFPKLKAIFRAGISKDNLPFEKAKQRGIKICLPSSKVADYIFEETANFTCYLILKMLYSEVGTIDPWEKYGRIALRNKKLLIIGMGKIGSKVAKKLDMLLQILTFDACRNSEDELYPLLSQADCITLHIPNSLDNKGYFDKQKLSYMKNGAILINTARGPIVSEDDLYDEIRQDRIKAAFDVYWEEPYKGKLLEYYPDRFFMTPHVASTCNEFLEGAARDLKEIMASL
ncbi:NAD(P)-dependent oxidoreductase [Sediminispirochaeta bajacaliforniensis]|uniref:NAD(P)-dependent oxidoreductase n=1 Tax=Sediminispirochaeta bajacaliforniensis TaxID=148 RepID=UPI0003685B86|nr:NAD(P)-dependent oxidoreductase [Sediminispirochaeta bajacaliforniensis]